MDQTQIESLPLELQPFAQQFHQSQLPCVNITAIPGKTTLRQSKFLGLPYLPHSEPYPLDAQGTPMILLAQLNFAEIPKLDGYPTQGILQFFISPHGQGEALYGSSLSDFEAMQAQVGFRIRFYEQVQAESHCIQDFEFLRSQLGDAPLYLPMECECELAFESGQSFIAPSDYRFDKILGPDFFAQFVNKADELQESYWQEYSGQGHRLGGYAYIPQKDPRTLAPDSEEWVLLLQIDSDDGAGIMWGDVGVASLFIQRQDLLNQDFSRVAYFWDCC